VPTNQRQPIDEQRDQPPRRPARRRWALGAAAAVALVGVGGLVVRWRSAAAEDPRLRFPPPELDDPDVVVVSADNADLELEPGRDYVIQMPDEPLDVEGGLQITGGDDVVLIGGEIRFSRLYDGDLRRTNRGLLLRDQTGTVHVEGLFIGGALTEGINLSESDGATVQLQNVRIETVTGSEDTNHADLIQTWAGPSRLLIDGLSGSTEYQGFFLLPNQHYDGPTPEGFELHDIDLVGLEGSRYLLWVDGPTPFPITVEGVWVEPAGDRRGDRGQYLWWTGDPDEDPWVDIRVGRPPDGEFVGPGDAGIGYVSPGYR